MKYPGSNKEVLVLKITKMTPFFLRLGRKNVVLIPRWLYKHSGRWARFHCFKNSCVSYAPTPLKLTGPLFSSGKVEHYSEQNTRAQSRENSSREDCVRQNISYRISHNGVALNVTAHLWASFGFLQRRQRQLTLSRPSGYNIRELNQLEVDFLHS